MRIDIDVSMDYRIAANDPVLLTLEAAQTDGQSVVASTLDIENASLKRISGEGIPAERIWASVPGERLRLRYRATVDLTHPVADLRALPATPFHALPGDFVTYLRPSRFCQSDLFETFVTEEFGHLEGGAKVAAIADWVASEISYVPASSTSATTASDTFVSRTGVCRDFAHLVCTLVRAAKIPARYTSGYGPNVRPQDFHAVAQVWLGDAWHLVDATGMSSADELAMIGAGRDAGDVAFMETEHWADVISQTVNVSRR